MAAICGMYGAYCNDPAAEQHLNGMLSALRPRGAGEAITHVDVSRQVMLGARGFDDKPERSRRDIVSSGDGALWIACDGELFNRAEVAARLAGGGRPPAARSTAEALLALYAAEGANGWRRADAQFALAIVDHTRRRLILGRDPLGVKAVYYVAGPKGAIFASEIKALLEHPAVRRELDLEAVSHYLTFLSVPAPRTLFAGVNKLPAGAIAQIQPDGAVEHAGYWDLLDDPIPERDDEQFYVERARELHRKALVGRLVDGPIGSLLSGGNDSSANAALIAKHAGGPLHTFTVGLRSVEGAPQYSDLHWAKRVAEHIGSRHHERLLSVDEFLASIPATIDAMDDLVSEPSAVFLHHALQMAQEQRVRVVITGEANDELACGHGEMIRIRDGYYRKWSPFLRTPAALRRLAARLAPHVSPKRRDILHRAATDDEYFWSFEIAWTELDQPEILTELALAKTGAERPGAVVRRIADRVRASEHGRRDFMNRMIYGMMQDQYFGNLMLGKLGLLAGRLGLDARAPYTAPEYAHLVFNIPARFKAKNGTVKHFFKEAIRDLLPDDVIYRPKQGFRTPVQELFAGKLGDWAEPHLLEEGLTRAGFVKRDALRSLLAAHREGAGDLSNKLWTAMALNLWYERWIKGARASAAAPRIHAVAAAPQPPRG